MERVTNLQVVDAKNFQQAYDMVGHPPTVNSSAWYAKI